MSTLASVRNFLRLVRSHPLTRENNWTTFVRLLRWQLASRLLAYPVVVPWVDDCRLVIKRGMVGATGNHYFGLHEFEDMGFLLHFLRQDELFIDIGANVGSYTVLAAAVRQARVVAVEPISSTFLQLLDNVNVNALGHRVRAFNVGLGASEGRLHFSDQLDAENHVVLAEHGQSVQAVEVQVKALDGLLGDERPVMIKMDVEGFETEVLRGGEAVFGAAQLQALLIELNGSGSRYGFDENAIRDRLESWGLHLCSYDPIMRKLQPQARSGVALQSNSLYVRDVQDAQARLSAAAPFHVLGRLI